MMIMMISDDDKVTIIMVLMVTIGLFIIKTSRHILPFLVPQTKASCHLPVADLVALWTRWGCSDLEQSQHIAPLKEIP